MGAGVQTGVVLEVTRVPMIKVFVISEWTSTSIPRFGHWPDLCVLNVPRGLAQDVAAAAVQPLTTIESDAAVPCLLQVSTEAVRVLDHAEEPPEISCTSLPKRFRVGNAGLDFVNGTYERYAENPLWVNTHNYEVYLRKGSDGNWCLVNNRGNRTEKTTDKDKKYYYVNRTAEVTAAAWREDTHGHHPPPSITVDHGSTFEQLFQAIFPSGSSWEGSGGRALVATPAIPTGCRPLVLTIDHFKSEAMVAVVAGEVDAESFPGLDDECISCVLQEPAGDFWQYTGK